MMQTSTPLNILVLNCGSSSIKFQIIRTESNLDPDQPEKRLAKGEIERIGSESTINIETEGLGKRRATMPLRDIRMAVEALIRWVCSDRSGINEIISVADIHAVGHRVVHGGEKFSRSVLIDNEVIRGIEDCVPLAPLHNPSNVNGIVAAREVLGAGLPQVAVFDTAFHQTMPERAYLYAVPYPYYIRYRFRRYGFHGTSFRYISERYRNLTRRSEADTNVIILHLGNGCSAVAIRGGRSIDTSMGITPLEGLVMGTRSGDVDPAMIEFLCAREGMTPHEAEGVLNKASGLLGISGLTNDMRDLLAEAEQHGDRRAKLAIDIFCYRAQKYIGAFLAALHGADAIIFAGGIGENSPEIRARICEGLEWAGLELAVDSNRSTIGGREGLISTDSGRLAAWVIPTNEELMIARDTLHCIRNSPQGSASA